MSATTLPAPAAACSRCHAALEPDDLRCPVCGLTTPVVQRPTPTALAGGVVRCESCHAAVVYAAEVQNARCAYCGSQMRAEVPEDPLEQAQAAVPFKVDAAGARGALKTFLARRRWFRPSKLSQEASVDSLRAVFWPAWVFDAEALASWAADSDAGSGRSAWAPHAGQGKLVFRNVVVSASKGLTSRECAALAGAYDLSAATDAPHGPDGAVVEPFEARRSGARQVIQEALESMAAALVEGNAVPGTRKRNVHVAVLPTGLRTTRYSLPAYVLAYRYRGDVHRVVVHGQDPACVTGKVPYSVAKIAATVAGGLLALAAIGVAVFTLAR